MYINNINKFLSNYNNIKKDDFLIMLEKSNEKSFMKYKLEKDFLLTLILIKFSEKYPDLIFKGGTCLNKIYFPYFRLSEDLDFALDTNLGRSVRKTILKKYENDLVEDLAILGLKPREGRTKYDEYKLALFTFEYKSILDNSIQTIKIDISIKNKLLLNTHNGKINSIYKDIILEEYIFGIHYINCIDLKEAIAEKLRASLTRNPVAIRDFFDIWYIKNYSDFDFEDKDFITLVNAKLQEVDYVYSIEENFLLLQKQIKTDLIPVLNDSFNFDFKGIYNFILTFKK